MSVRKQHRLVAAPLFPSEGERDGVRGFRGSASGADNSGWAKARTDANGTTFYHNDAGGNITAMTDGNGNVVARYLYDPFGNLLAKSVSVTPSAA